MFCKKFILRYQNTSQLTFTCNVEIGKNSDYLGCSESMKKVKVYASVDVNVTHEYPGETKTNTKRFETIDEASMYVDWMNSGVVRCDPYITSVSIDFNRGLLGQP